MRGPFYFGGKNAQAGPGRGVIPAAEGDDHSRVGLRLPGLPGGQAVGRGVGYKILGRCIATVVPFCGTESI